MGTLKSHRAKGLVLYGFMLVLYGFMVCWSFVEGFEVGLEEIKQQQHPNSQPPHNENVFGKLFTGVEFSQRHVQRHQAVTKTVAVL